jgi:death-on-curing protein
VKEPARVDERDARTLHEKLVAVHGGTGGIRDEGLLISAMARPRKHVSHADKPDLVAMAAAYTTGIVKYHPFLDGNKRVGFVVGILFLEINGYKFLASEEQAAIAVIDLAAGNLDEAGYRQLLDRHLVREQQRAR